MAGTLSDSDSTVDDCLQLLQTLLACGRDLRRQLATVTRPIDLNDTQFLVLWSCSHAPSTGISQRDLVAKLGISPAQVSALVEGLRRRDLLVGQRCPHDRRRQIWCLTSEGRAMVDSAATTLQPWATSVARRLGSRDLMATVQALASTTAPIDDTSPPDDAIPSEAPVDTTLRITRGAA